MHSLVPELLVQHFKEKKRLLEINDQKHKKIKTALVIDGGAMRGVFAGGVVAALKKLGFEDIFDMIVAVSSGTISALYFASGEAELASKVFYEDLASKRFINILKFNPKKIVGIDYSNQVFQKSKPIKEIAVRGSRSKIFFGVTDPDTGKEVYLDIKKDNINCITAMHASSAVPLLHSKPVIIHNKQYLDGMIACGIPITPALQAGCTDILIIENMPIEKPNFLFSTLPLRNLLFSLYRLHMTSSAKKALDSRKKRYYQTLDEIKTAQKRGVAIGIISPDKLKINPLSINSKLLQKVAQEAREQTIRAFTQ
jgi:predicted patatin/cPLA2 family phospholipase